MKRSIAPCRPVITLAFPLLSRASTGEAVFEESRAIPLPTSASSAAGDFDLDGETDLASTLDQDENAVLFQGPVKRSDWTRNLLAEGNAVFLTCSVHCFYIGSRP
jgi:hypothetical protein